MVISREDKLGLLIQDLEIAQVWLGGQFVAKAKTIVKDAEGEGQLAGQLACLLQVDAHLAVMIADKLDFAPGLFPGLVMLLAFDLGNAQVLVERWGVGKAKAQSGGLQDSLPLMVNCVMGHALQEEKADLNVAVG